MRHDTGHDKRLREARRTDALVHELARARERCDALADALRDAIRIMHTARGVPLKEYEANMRAFDANHPAALSALERDDA